ncbi:ferritin heavy chain-like [Fukomys damarensis]|uniref:Ferritin n=1 Tax=Fukomys damarensis TaxID=885580 RepID=A0A091CX25_FUKDA|nr:ferritin heavy chain-like [Fukomys damarensis]KFO23222.1 Ferritin heavy chain [Fukomys damarensis]
MAAAPPPMTSPTPPLLGQSYHAECEAAVNLQIQLQLYASYVYLSMAMYCGRLDVALKSLSGFFLRRSHQWRQLAEKLMWMLNERGGSVALRDIAKPDRDDWHGSAQAVECAYHLEDTLYRSLQELHRLAAGRGDPSLCDFLVRTYLQPQVLVLRELSCYLSNLRRVGPRRDGLLDVLFGKLSLDDGGKEDKDG